MVSLAKVHSGGVGDVDVVGLTQVLTIHDMIFSFNADIAGERVENEIRTLVSLLHK